MKLSEALIAIEKIYIPGVVGFYANQKPNKWQEAFDALGHDLRAYVGDEAKLQRSADEWVSKCKALINQAKPFLSAKEQLSLADALLMGDENKVKSEWASRANECERCATKENVSVVPGLNNHGLLLCDNCKLSIG